MFSLSSAWQTAYPAASMGILVVGEIHNTLKNTALEAEKRALALALRSEYPSREVIKTIPALQAYAAYYKRFKKNYHVFFQLESVAVKGKPIPSQNALVEAMFMAELRHGLLTAGHDMEAVVEPICLGAAAGTEHYLTLRGEVKTLKPGDMAVRDAQGVLSSIIYGPDQRTRISEKTKRALFTVYAPDGIDLRAITRHMQDLNRWIKVFSPRAKVEKMAVFSAALPQGSEHPVT